MAKRSYSHKKNDIQKEDDWESDYDFEDEDLKMVFIVREDLKMSIGKISAQVAHSAVGLYKRINKGKSNYYKQVLEHWTTSGAKKVVLKGKDESELISLKEKCIKLKIPYYLVADAGRTEIAAGSVTVLGIGPDISEKINTLTGKLRLY